MARSSLNFFESSSIQLSSDERIEAVSSFYGDSVQIGEGLTCARRARQSDLWQLGSFV